MAGAYCYILLCILASLIGTFSQDEVISFGGAGTLEDPFLELRPGDKEPIIVMQGGHLESQCIIENVGISDYEISWVRIHRNGTREVLSPNDTIFIANLSQKDIEQPIICEALRLDDDKIFEKELKVKLIVTNYKVFVTPKSPEIIIGEPYVLQCNVEPSLDVPKEYTWFFKGKVVGRGELLRIENFSTLNSGQYVCNLQEVYDQYTSKTPFAANASFDARLIPSEKPHYNLLSAPGAQLLTILGDNRELHCELGVGIDSTQVVWYHNGSRLDYYSSVNRTGNINQMNYRMVSILSIKGILEEQGGFYECRFNDKKKQVKIFVLSDYYVEVNPNSYDAHEGGLIELHCMVEGGLRVQNFELKWFFRPVGSLEIYPLNFTQDTFTRTDDTRTSLTTVITNVNIKKSDEGTYICREPRGLEGRSNVRVRSTGSNDIRLHISSDKIYVKPYMTTTIECTAMDFSGKQVDSSLHFRSLNANIDIKTEKLEGGKIQLIIPRIETVNNGTIIECYSDDKSIPPVRSIIFVTGVCEQGYRQCSDGTCMQTGRFCDGNKDCPDGSDEDINVCGDCDPVHMVCEKYNDVEPIKRTIMFHWKCDGENDCGNGFDESDCRRSDPSTCNDQYFTCPSSQKQISRAYVCDGEMDCEESEDEQDCAAPTILSTGRSEKVVRPGQEVWLECVATGNPLPRVIWRFNWKCLPSQGGRFKVDSLASGCGRSNQRLVSTLKISSIKPGDDGIYNCEALDGTKRTMSEDYIVIIRN